MRYKTNRDERPRSCLLSSSSRFLPFSGSDTRPLPLPILVNTADSSIIARLLNLIVAYNELDISPYHSTVPGAVFLDAQTPT